MTTGSTGTGWLEFVPKASRVERAFMAWTTTRDGQRVEAEAVRLARELRANGRKRYGMKAIFEVVRYNADIGLLGDGEFKLNNNHTSLLARRIMERYPDLAGFFETRELRGRF